MYNDIVKLLHNPDFWNVICALGFLPFYFYMRRNRDLLAPLNPNFKIQRGELGVFLTLTVLFLIFNFKLLFEPLTNDELFHVGNANELARDLVFSLAKQSGFFDAWIFKDLMWAFNFLQLVLTGACFWLWWHFRPSGRKAWWIGLPFFFMISHFLWLSHDVHPPLRLLPIWLFNTLLGPFNVSTRLPQFLVYLAWLGLVWRTLVNQVGGLRAFCVTIMLGSIPVAMHCATIVEFSIWTTLIASALFLGLQSWEGKPPNNIKIVLAAWLISLGALIRQPIFLLSLPLIGYVAVLKWQSRRASQGERPSEPKWRHLSPLLLMLPFCVRVLIMGTPATQKGTAALPFLTEDLSTWGRLQWVINSGTFTEITLRQVGPVVLLGAVFALIPLRKNQWLQKIWIAASFLILWVSFYAIAPILYGVGRYQAELWLPFFTLGSIIGMIHLHRLKSWLSMAFAITALLFATFNMHQYLHIFEWQTPIDKTRASTQWPWILSKMYFNWDEALKITKVEGYADSVLLLGPMYGSQAQIQNRYSVREVVNGQWLFNRFGWQPWNFESMLKEKRIRLVLMTTSQSNHQGARALFSEGWKPWKDFPSINAEDLIIGVTKAEDIR